MLIFLFCSSHVLPNWKCFSVFCYDIELHENLTQGNEKFKRLKKAVNGTKLAEQSGFADDDGNLLHPLASLVFIC